MRLLLIAYEFPPSPSPQSLRWTYFARELAALGHEVHVLTADLGGDTPGLPALPGAVRVHRTFPGPLRGALAAVRQRRARRAAEAKAGRDSPAALAGPAPLRPPRNWQQRISERVQAVAGHLHFPDIRGEWRRHGQRALGRLVDALRPDVVISSHEPATTLELGLSLRDRRLPWVVDLGDPVLAPYTPERWRRRSEQLEQAVFRHAAHVLVTNPRALELMRSRHGPDTPISVVTQGFDQAFAADAGGSAFDPARLELLYTGSLYAFRRIDSLLAGLRADPRIRLSLAAVTVPETILQAARDMPGQLRLLGHMPHLAALALQRQADVLVNIANDDPSQIPGKFYEYLGAGRPVLHLADTHDLAAAQVGSLRRGWVCANEGADVAALLSRLLQAKDAGTLHEGLALEPDGVAAHSWQQQAIRLDAVLRGVLAQSLSRS